ncbi:hypothetical protein [Clostridium sp. C2-6-12]|uniref:hypothetical protein n=1 Tax=Clostridium sp. C2-6-12 TaxID=2698832 RepID=UPI00136A8018|nr:hypothetical protein [Clostridium sp. C2-6-12]
MNKIGEITDLKEDTAKVTFKDMDNAVSDWLPINSMKCINCSLGATCTTKTDISLGDTVLVCFYNNNLKDGVIVAKVG